MLALYFFLSIPIILSGSMHMLICKKNYFPFLAKPISVSLFGKNKTYRGLIIMPILGWLGLSLTQLLAPIFQINLLKDQSILFLGLSLGLAYAMMELPNSFIKRQMQIPAGGKAKGSLKYLFILIDQTDSTLGCLLVYSIFFPSLFSFNFFISFFIFAIFLNLIIKRILFFLGVKNEPF